MAKNQAITGSGPGATGQTKPEQLIPDENKPQKEKDESDSSEDAKLADTRPVSKPEKEKQPQKGSAEWENNASGKSDVYSPEKIAIYVSMISSLLPPEADRNDRCLISPFQLFRQAKLLQRAASLEMNRNSDRLRHPKTDQQKATNLPLPATLMRSLGKRIRAVCMGHGHSTNITIGL